ncbi:hypothetical protein GW17_00000607 [Ensete ventricosum]|nr:hypothetical protein GW17_00000607 [Ensete ventricosum]
MQSGDGCGGKGGHRGGNDHCGWGDRQRWLQQKRDCGRRKKMRVAATTAVADGRSRCGNGGWQPLGYDRGGYVGSSGDRGDNKICEE